MRSFFTAALFICSLLLVKTGFAQTADQTILTNPWNAYWINAKNETGRDYGVFYFRKSIDLAAKPTSFMVNVSADNRYKLYVNGTLVSVGPARGDTYYWNYEKIDLAPYLITGKNTVSAIVWNEAELRPEAQISLRTAFILQGSTANEELLNTNSTWKCIRDKAYQPVTGGVGYPAYYVAGPGEMVDQSKTLKGCMTAGFDDSAWPNAGTMEHGKPKGMADAFGWMLVPSSLPQMERTYQRIPVLRKAEGLSAPASFPATKTAITIPANTTATLLLDQTYLTNAYLTLNFSKGKGAGISITYAEAMFDNLKKYHSRKGNRNDIEGKDFAGRKDSLIADGSDGQTFTTLYWRTYRYIRLIVQTKDEPLAIEDIYGTSTGYPFQLNAKLKTDDPEMQKMLEIGWRTARMDAIETYMDCPYYEQLQYIGDGRIQMMLSYYNSGDDRLARNAINLMDQSRIAEGLTLSRHPSYSPQIISTFSLWYIGVLHDYWMYRPDSSFVKEKLQGARTVLDFFSKYQQADGSLKNTPYWTFVDWASSWGYGMPPKGTKGGSSILDLQLLIAYQQAGEMEAKMGMPAFASMYRTKAAQLKQTIQNKYWDPVKKRYADTEDKNIFSQHANSLAILTGLIKGTGATALGKSILADTTLTQCTIYFKYYMHQALVKGGLGNDYMKWLDVWRNNIKMGLTTWAEISDLPNSRSDCHAWGASPNIEFFRTILGIDSYAPGFAKVKIEPHLGDLKTAGGEIPHPNGKVAVEYTLDKSAWKIKIMLPQKTTGLFVWKGKVYPIKAGENLFKI
ncbi:alpha-L-rhamnosidase C-terminal domain-containing protein [Mucilaginibacter sp.]|uniref:alpha-L-rhamnosidase-related protein n=1 Tax=Mucilaginibacter sp. TaxID=1882438 RepID=UPI00262C822A|nr:alpha-L-rhamnosidase C-terminal domain-containing protein [Mucilaginibacter sp.]MDB4918295.1 alpha-rhamnosidase [Mucilaginibacter sp.]